MQSLTANISEDKYNTPTKQKQRFSYQRSSTSGFIELNGRLDLGPCSASPLATAASTVACLESGRTMRRYALLACRKPAEAETAAQLEIAVKDVTVEGSGDGPADDEKDYNSSDYTNGSTNGSSVDGDILDALDGGANEVAALATGSYADGAEDPGAAAATPLVNEPRVPLPIGPTSAFRPLPADLEAEAPAEEAPQHLGDTAAPVPAATDAATPAATDNVSILEMLRPFLPTPTPPL